MSTQHIKIISNLCAQAPFPVIKQYVHYYICYSDPCESCSIAIKDDIFYPV